MISLIYILFLIIFHTIKIVYSQDSPVDILGPSACDYFGSNYEYCATPDIAVENLPKNCSSYLYMYLYAYNNTLFDQGSQGRLDQLIKTNTNVLIYYYHGTQVEWCAAVNCDTAVQTAEMNDLKCFLDNHPGVKGIILRSLLDLDSEVTSAECSDYTQNLQKYIDLMHKTFPNLSIGIVISSPRARDWYNNPELAWLDYSVLDSSVDFYVVNFQNLNSCSDEFSKTGCYPLCGNNNNTVEAMKTFLNNAGVSSTKVHYTFYMYGDPKIPNFDCGTMPISWCNDVQDAKNSICSDTLQTLYDKGAFASKNGAGFVANYIDGDDYDCTCQCGQLFPAFHALLDGYNGASPPVPCALYDRT